MKTKLITAAAVLIVLIGFGILLYPVVSNMIFQKGQEELITYYENQIKEIPAEEINTMLNDCRKYNQELLTSKVKLTDPFDDKLSELEEHPYIDLLNENGDGSMGFIEIPSINCRLVVYHYTKVLTAFSRVIQVLQTKSFSRTLTNLTRAMYFICIFSMKLLHIWLTASALFCQMKLRGFISTASEIS